MNISPILSGIYGVDDVINHGIYFSFGCANNCSFCCQDSYFKGVYFREKSVIIEELEYINSKFENDSNVLIKIADNDISKHPDIVGILIQSERYASFHFSAQLRIDQASVSVISHLKKSNVKYVSFGLETADKELLRKINKTPDPEKYLRRIKNNIKKLGNKVIGTNIILNLPNENAKGIDKTVKFIKNNGIIDIVINYYVDIYDFDRTAESVPKYQMYNRIFLSNNIRYIDGKSEAYKNKNIQLFKIISESGLSDMRDIFKDFVSFIVQKNELEAYAYHKRKNEDIVIGKPGEYIKIFSNKYNFIIKDYIRLKKINLINFISAHTFLYGGLVDFALVAMLNRQNSIFKVINTAKYQTIRRVHFGFFTVEVLRRTKDGDS